MTSGGGALEGTSGQGARRPSEPHRDLSTFIGLRGLSLLYPPCGSPSGSSPCLCSEGSEPGEHVRLGEAGPGLRSSRPLSPVLPSLLSWRVGLGVTRTPQGEPRRRGQDAGSCWALRPQLPAPTCPAFLGDGPSGLRRGSKLCSSWKASF